jgi:hypothetical protein
MFLPAEAQHRTAKPKQNSNFLSSTVCIHDAYAYTWNMDLFIFVYACADFPGAKVVSEAVAKSGTSPLLPAITFILDKVAPFIPKEEPKAEPVAEATSREVAVEEKKEEAEPAAATEAAPAPAETPSEAAVVEEKKEEEKKEEEDKPAAEEAAPPPAAAAAAAPEEK